MQTKLLILKGDVYIFVPENRKLEIARRVGMLGPLLECVRKNIFLASWMATNNEVDDAEPEELGYWRLRGNQGEGKVEWDYTLGYFIPNAVSKTDVAEDIRRKYGKTAALIKTPFGPRHVPDAKTAYLSHIKAKHRRDKPELVQDLINECAEAFAALPDSSSLQDTYLKIREKLQVSHGVRVS